jgi:hypothetical protein
MVVVPVVVCDWLPHDSLITAVFGGGWVCCVGVV